MADLEPREAWESAGRVPTDAAEQRTLLKLPTMRRFVIGIAVTDAAFWALLSASFAMSIYRFDASATDQLILLACFSLPFIVMVPIQGVLVDRWSPKWVLVIAYVILACAIPITMAASSIAWLWAAQLVIGLADSAIRPARSALVALLAPDELTVQANGLAWGAVQVALIAGNLVSAMLLGDGQYQHVFWAALAMAAAGIPFLATVPDRRHGGERPDMTVRDLADGARTAIRHPELRLLFVLAASMFAVLSLVFALEGKYVAETLGLSERALPILWSIHGAGALVAAIGVSRAKAPGGRELGYVGGALILSGAGLVVYMATTNVAIAAIGTATLGAGLSLYFAPAYALIQRASGKERRGRVTSVFEILQETIGFVSSVAFATLALPDSAVRPVLAAGGVAIATAGAFGSAAAGRLHRRLETSRGSDQAA